MSEEILEINIEKAEQMLKEIIDFCDHLENRALEIGNKYEDFYPSRNLLNSFREDVHNCVIGILGETFLRISQTKAYRGICSTRKYGISLKDSISGNIFELKK